jgi:hypothetical protein
VANLLGQRPPPVGGLLVAVCAVPAVVAIDAVHKWFRAHQHSAGAPRAA